MIPAMTCARRFSLVIISGLLAVGCGDDGGGGDGGTGTSGTDTGTAGGMTTASMTTASMTTAAMTTTDGTSTGAPDETTTGNGTTMAPADSSGTAGMDSTGDSATGTTTGGGEATYPECMPDADPVCPKEYDDCVQLMQGNYNFCTVTCEGPDDCPDPSSGTAIAICGGPNQDRCELDCGDDATCPDGMECIGVGPGMTFMRCAWMAG